MEMLKIQERIKMFCDQNNMNSPIEFRVLDLISEAGELSKEILKSSNYGKNEVQLTEEMKIEMGDLFFSLIVSANTLKIDLEEQLNNVLAKYERRLKKGGAGSEND